MSKLRTLALIAAVSGLCVLVTLLASIIASRRPDAERLDTATRSLLRADYSADKVRPKLAPLSPAIINAAAEDTARLNATEVRIAPRNDTPTGSSSQTTDAPANGSTPTTGGGAVSTPRPGQPPAGSLPTATLSPAQPTPTPIPGASTPGPGGTPVPTPTLPPGVTATNTPPPGAIPTPPITPAPGATAAASATAVPTATPSPAPTTTSTPVPTPTSTPSPTPTLTATPTTGYTPLLPLPCAVPGSLVSLVETEILFDNRSSETVRVFWVNALGVAQNRGTLAPGDQLTFDTYATHSWVVRDLQGNCIAAYTLAIVPGIAVIN